jgi:hypothetical protein
MRVDRRHIHISKIDSESKEETISMTKSEALSFVWELSKEAFSLTGSYNVKSRLQRNVVSIVRK